jgi:hypothetical protein
MVCRSFLSVIDAGALAAVMELARRRQRLGQTHSQALLDRLLETPDDGQVLGAATDPHGDEQAAENAAEFLRCRVRHQCRRWCRHRLQDEMFDGLGIHGGQPATAGSSVGALAEHSRGLQRCAATAAEQQSFKGEDRRDRQFGLRWPFTAPAGRGAANAVAQDAASHVYGHGAPPPSPLLANARAVHGGGGLANFRSPNPSPWLSMRPACGSGLSRDHAWTF